MFASPEEMRAAAPIRRISTAASSGQLPDDRVAQMNRKSAKRISAWTLALGLAFSMTSQALAQTGKLANYCARTASGGASRPITAALAPLVMKAFDINIEEAKAAGFYRCAEGKLLVCYVGANLPCGKANVSRRLASADKYCRENPNEASIPMYATGHDTIYSWRCDGKTARPGPPVQRVDAQGYFIDYWKQP
jgi:hypothetical protein